MVRCSMISLAAILGASALAAQSPAPVQKSFGVVGQPAAQPQAGTNAPSVFVLPSPAKRQPARFLCGRSHRSGGGVMTTGKSQIVGPMQHIRPDSWSGGVSNSRDRSHGDGSRD